MEIVVDAYGPEEQALGWYAYLNDALQWPLLAPCVAERATSPLQIGDEVEVVGMPPEDVCEHEMFRPDPVGRRTLASASHSWPRCMLTSRRASRSRTGTTGSSVATSSEAA
jgi:Calcium binding